VLGNLSTFRVHEDIRSLEKVHFNELYHSTEEELKARVF